MATGIKCFPLFSQNAKKLLLLSYKSYIFNPDSVAAGFRNPALRRERARGEADACPYRDLQNRLVQSACRRR
jgi:hypothetical protein